MARVEVNGIGLEYNLHGVEGAPVIVLVNGLLTDQNSWAKQLPTLTEHFRILTYDCRGQGASDKPDMQYTIALHTEDLKQLLDAIGFEYVSIVGLSNGASIAMQFASTYPDRVDKLMLISSYAATDNVIRAKLHSWVSAMEYGGALLRFDVATPYVWGATFLRDNYEALLPFREYGGTIPLDAARNLIQGAIAHDLGDRVKNITATTVIVVGEEDILTPIYYAEQLQSGIPKAELIVLPKVGHALPLENSQRFNQVLRQCFIDSQ